MLQILIFLLAVCLVSPAFALESEPVGTSRTTATLVTEVDAVQPGKPMRLGLRLKMQPGWHTYWQNPGDAGVAPEIDLTLSAGATHSEIAWPVPVRQAEGPLMTYAYVGDLLLPLTVMPGEGPLRIEASATWLVCARICVPEEGKFRLELPVGVPVGSAQSALFDGAMARIPGPAPFEASIARDGTLGLEGSGLSKATVRDAWFFPRTAGIFDAAAPVAVEIEAGRLKLGLTPAAGFHADAALDGVVVIQEPSGGERYFNVTAKPGGLARAVAEPGAPLWQIMAMALAGGLILNLMPCVFPVLALKAMGLARLPDQARGTVRAHAATYTAGVLAAFGLLAAVLIGVRASGSFVGWGFQFQSPVFVTAMAWVLFGTGLNLSGLFHIGTALAGAGQSLAGKQSYAGSFFTGLLAVLVATPCTGPFMGAAVAFALASAPMVTVLLFLCMGLGLAIPYVLLAVMPGLSALLPRPGLWMNHLKVALAFPMYGAAAWLVWVVGLQAGPDGVLSALIGMVLLGFAAWTYGLAQVSRRRVTLALSGLALVATVFLLRTVHLDGAPREGAEAGVEAFSPARLAALHQEGRPVFVNMTAAWCVSCLVNERLVLSPSRVKQAFADHRVVYLKGDWTRNDPVITDYLREHDRDGVPLYVLYPAGNARPIILSQILTEHELLEELGKL